MFSSSQLVILGYLGKKIYELSRLPDAAQPVDEESDGDAKVDEIRVDALEEAKTEGKEFLLSRMDNSETWATIRSETDQEAEEIKRK